ncbi:MAG TPA: hypothetical protein VNQ77_15000 [Frankiaceae bacterium]|nr:hypothetical protein [Frankiaceae bacterium]
MSLTFENLRVDGLHGSTLADYLSGIEADLQLLDGAQVIYEEPSFPVCELARALRQWIRSGAEEDFVFESMSFEESGVVTIERRPDGWVFRSVFTPEVESSVTPWSEVERSVLAFTSELRSDLASAGIDADYVIGR